MCEASAAATFAVERLFETNSRKKLMYVTGMWLVVHRHNLLK